MENSAQDKVYVFSVVDLEEETQSFGICHEVRVPIPGAMVRVGNCPNYLAGYLEGATSGRWDRVNIENGFPRYLEHAFGRYEFAKLDQEQMKAVLEKSDLATFYPHLVVETL